MLWDRISWDLCSSACGETNFIVNGPFQQCFKKKPAVQKYHQNTSNWCWVCYRIFVFRLFRMLKSLLKILTINDGFSLFRTQTKYRTDPLLNLPSYYKIDVFLQHISIYLLHRSATKYIYSIFGANYGKNM